MEGVDVSSTRRRHLSLEMQGEVVGQEMTGSQPRATVQSALTNVQANHEIWEALE